MAFELAIEQFSCKTLTVNMLGPFGNPDPREIARQHRREDLAIALVVRLWPFPRMVAGALVRGRIIQLDIPIQAHWGIGGVSVGKRRAAAGRKREGDLEV
jgi:hypothetical protein